MLYSYKDMKKNTRAVLGTISITGKGTGYVHTKEFEDDIEIEPSHLNTALHGDTVEVFVHSKNKTSLKGEISRIISRAKKGFSGVLKMDSLKNKRGGIFFLHPDDTKMYTDILIPKQFLNSAKEGQKVYAEILSWKNPQQMPEGKIMKILGKAGDNDAEMQAIAIEKGFDADMPKAILDEAEKIKGAWLKKENFGARMDFRKTLTFTIDPEDAKDFDDALSFKELRPNEEKDLPEGGYEVGVHIADVTHFVKEGNAIDEEARTRGTSVYLVDRTIPMLPEILSNDLCSLVPNEDRLTMSAVFLIDKNGKIKKEKFGKSIIHSIKRFTYEEAEKSIKDKNAYLHKELHTLNELAKKLNKDRFDKGAISLEQDEVKFILDKTGKPLKVIKKTRGDSNKMIEEFMLLANKKVAEIFSLKNTKNSRKNKENITEHDNENVFIYRIHDAPDREKVTDLAFFLRSLGHKIPVINGEIPKNEINKILKNISGKNEEDTVRRAIVKSMAKAIYSTKNIGHYGLAFEYYAHFTSPIRRYPDMVAHRLLDDFLSGKKPQKDRVVSFEEIAIKSSEREKFASDAERASIKYKQTEYMSARLGQTFTGIISGVTEWGIYIEELETKCEGFSRLRDMKDDFYIFNEKRLELIGEKHKKTYRLGDKVKIKVKSADLEKKMIDYSII